MKKNYLSSSLKLGAIAALVASTGCAEYHRRVLDGMEAKGSEFTTTLSKQYEELGKTEQHIMYDQCSADYYYRRAICAKEGYSVEPSHPEKWDIQCDKMPELVTARARLMNAIASGAREAAPKMTAYAQAYYDCWVEQQSEGWQTEDIASCRGEFYTSMAEVEFMLMGGIEVAPSSMVLFDFNTSHLSKEAMHLVDAVAEKARSMNFQNHILLVGRTDKVGDVKHNKHLSKNRAIAVKKELIRRGVPSHLVSIKAAGETPGPNVDAHNRRVDVIFLDHK